MSTDTTPTNTREHVIVVQIDHRHGSDTEVFRSEVGALNSLHGYVVREWDAEVNGRWAEDGDTKRAIPADRDEAISAYFGSVEDEFYQIETLPLND